MRLGRFLTVQGDLCVNLPIRGIDDSGTAVAIESLNSTLRGVSRKWKNAQREWTAAMTQFAMMFGDRFSPSYSWHGRDSLADMTQRVD